MIKYVSNKGGGKAVDFQEAILAGYAPDGGLYVPQRLPQVSTEQMEQWKQLSYPDLAFEILSLFIDRRVVTAQELKAIINKAYGSFEKEKVIPIKKLKSRKGMYMMELYYGATLSFKDIGLSFLVHLVDFFLQKKQDRLSIIVATTGDTGPAAASYISRTSTLDAWVLYPKGMITEEQERQMTTLHHENVHPVGVFNCPEGGDDLDTVIKNLYANKKFKERVKLSSVNSINWGRVMIQTVHFFYGYFQVTKHSGEKISIAVPSGAFGNLCAGGLARKMGLPIQNLIVANNKNECLNRIFRRGIFSKEPIHETASSAIDILIPLNFWRYLYFCVDGNSRKLKEWWEEFDKNGIVQFDQTTFSAYKEGFLAGSTSDEEIMNLIRELFETEGYLLDPHAAVSLAVADAFQNKLEKQKVICLATAHPAKFPKIIQQSLGITKLPEAAFHFSIEKAKKQCQKGYSVEQIDLEEALLEAMTFHWEQNRKNQSKG
jgi:threonine synthase